jgi:predicted AlkP superfamily phosphohydrolase/phosphomutase
MAKRLCVIGLDCLTPQLLFGPWLDEMPNVRRVMAGGIHGNLVSTTPPITVPAWMAMMTSQDPGMLGIYGFRNRASHEYEDNFIVNGSHVKARPLWNHLSRRGLHSIVIGVPLTFPPTPLRGVMAADFLTPSKTVTWTFPASLGGRLDAWAGGDFILDVPDFRSVSKREILDQIYRMTKGRFQAFRKLLTVEPWDFAIMVEMGPDRIHHAFWRYLDPTHPLYEAGNEFEDVIHRYYLYLDEEIGRMVEALPTDTSLMVISDHGAKAMHGAFCINEWLIREGLLVLKSDVSGPVRLQPGMIDWDRTRVWSDGGYYARIFLNIAGREPRGQIPAAGVEAFKRDLAARLEATTDPAGKRIGTRVFLPEDVYRERNGTPPDLIVYLGDLDWRSASTVGAGIHLFENDTGPDDANHAQEGIFIWQGRGREPRDGEPKDSSKRVSIYDVAPSILDYYGIETPAEMIGRVL